MATYSVIEVQQVNGGGVKVGTVQTPAFASNPATGDLILVAVASWNNSATTHNAPTDTAGNTYVRIGPQLGNLSDAISLWACVNAAGGSSFRITSTTSVIAFRTVVAWCVRPSATAASDGDVAEAICNDTSGSPVTSPAPPSSAFFLCIATRGTTNSALTKGSGWNATGVNGFTAGMETAASYGLESANVALYTEYKIASTVLTGDWTDNFSSSATRSVIVASFAAAAATGRFRKTLSGLGTRTGSRQVHW